MSSNSTHQTHEQIKHPSKQVYEYFSIVSPTSTTFDTNVGPSTSNGHYGTFQQPHDGFSIPSSPTPTQPLLPANRPLPSVPAPSRSILPFTSLVVPFTALLGFFSWVATRTTAGAGSRSDVEHHAARTDTNGTTTPDQYRNNINTRMNVQRKFTVGRKYYPLIAGESEVNIPLAILRRLSEWVALLETRGATGGATIGGMMGCLANFEDALSGLERILTTPLPL